VLAEPVFELEVAPVAAPLVPVVEPFAPPLPLLATVRSSFTFLTPVTDFASFLASLRSSLLLTDPVSFTVPLSTSTCTFCRFGLLASCS
jgi:hypothetical protein